jgi:arylsulfatase A-like enzyme
MTNMEKMCMDNEISRRGFLAITGGAVAAASLATSCVGRPKPAATRPNIVLIMVDDMGYSDLGCYGGEIPTPNIDNLAENGIKFTQFYNTARCCPTRASLLTGLHPHQTGIGGMTNSPKKENDISKSEYGYTGFLNRDCVTIAEVLKPAGYHTYMTGKWHLGYHAQDRWPLQRGFDRFYGINAGAASYLDPQPPRGLSYGNTPVQPEGDNYYTTDAFTDYAVKFMEEQQDDKPFFLYLAYNAPHWPLHAKEEDTKLFLDKYGCGWDELRLKRHAHQLDMGLLDKKWPLSDRDPGVRPWNVLSEQEKRELEYRMAVYAAQIYAVDYNVGKVVDALKKMNKLDNTLLIFLDDNGGCPEPWTDKGGGDFSDINDPAKSGSISYGQGWANASNTPFRRFKTELYEGGMSTPLIVHWPDRIVSQQGKMTDAVGYLLDIMPTVLEVSGAEYPTEFNGHKIHPLEGQSLMPAFETGNLKQHEWMFWEHVNGNAVRWGKWKAVKPKDGGDDTWELYDVEADRTETRNLATEQPEVFEKLKAEWHEWAVRCHVVPKS